MFWTLPLSALGAFPHPVHTKTLDNGCELVVVEMPSKGVVATAVWMDVGSRNEVEEGRTGFAHFFEHLAFSGTPTWSPDAREKELLRLGIGDNAWTWLDETVYIGTTDTRSLDAWMGLQADMLAHLALTPDEVRREAGAVYGEYRKSEAGPRLHLEQAMRREAFSVHPYGHDTLGYEADIAAMPDSHDYAMAFYERWYGPQHARVILVGDVKHESAFAMLETHFGPWERREPEVPDIPVEPPFEGPKSARVPWPVEIPPRLMLGWRTPAHDDTNPEIAALALVDALLLGSAGRLTNRLIREEAIALSVSGGRQATVDPGLFTIDITLKDASHRARALEVVREELDRLVEGVEPTDLKRTRDHVRYAELTSMDDPESVLYMVGSSLRRGADASALDAFDTQLAAIEPPAIGQVVERFLTPERQIDVWLAHEVTDAE